MSNKAYMCQIERIRSIDIDIYVLKRTYTFIFKAHIRVIKSSIYVDFSSVCISWASYMLIHVAHIC